MMLGRGTRRAWLAATALAVGAWMTVVAQGPQVGAPTDPPLGPDSQVQPGVPPGDLIKGVLAGSRVYPGTWREHWVYIPQQLDRATPAPVMVFQDGLQYNAPVVVDHLIHRKDTPPTVGVFVMHGRVPGPPRL